VTRALKARDQDKRQVRGEHMSDYEPIIIMLIILLVPGIPAYILYSRLPHEKTIVTGPFRGLQLHLTGAFAAYFVLVVLAMGFFLTFMSQRSGWSRQADFETWVITGELKSDDPDARLTDASITFSPRLLEVRDDGSFFTVLPLQTGGPGKKATTMQIEHPLFSTAVVHLSKGTTGGGYASPYKMEVDTAAKIINITPAIALKAAPNKYVETQAYQPQLVPDPAH
jgi:hypothetical protein